MNKKTLAGVAIALLMLAGCNSNSEPAKDTTSPSARAMGFDTLIMGMRDADALRSLFGIPENETVMAVISLGYRAQEPRQPQHSALDDIVKFY